MVKRDPRNKQEIWGLILFFFLFFFYSACFRIDPDAVPMFCPHFLSRSDKTRAETTVDEPVEFGVAIGSILREHTG